MLFDNTPKASVIQSMSHPHSKSKYRPFLSCRRLSSGIPWFPRVYSSGLDGQRVDQRLSKGVGCADMDFLIFDYFREFRTTRVTRGKTFRKFCTYFYRKLGTILYMPFSILVSEMPISALQKSIDNSNRKRQYNGFFNVPG